MKKRVDGLVLIAAGLIIFFLNPISNLTGFTIGESIASAAGVWLYVFGLAMMIGGILVINLGGVVSSSRSQISKLQKILEGAISVTTLPHYSSASEGIENSKPLEAFTAPTTIYGPYSLFTHVEDNDESREVAHALVKGSSIYGIPELEATHGKTAYSLDTQKLEKLGREALIKGKIKSIRIVRTDRLGFKEVDTATGRYWEREAHSDSAHEKIGVPKPHYNVEYKKKGTNLHILSLN